MRKTKFKNRTFATNAIAPATTTGKHWGFIPVPCKGGATTNAVNPVKKSEE